MDWSKASKEKLKLAKGEKLIGLSMSKCVNDIILGHVQVEDVMAIVASTRMTKKEHPMTCYWMVWEAKAEEAGLSFDQVEGIVNKLWDRIIQPRIYDFGYIPDSDLQHWVKVPSLTCFF